MSGSWSNTSTELVIIQAGGTFTGLFVYSPTIGADNLVASIAAQAGTDPYGNPYLQGVAVYTGEGADGNIFMQMDPSIGAWVSGQMKSGAWDQNNAGSIQVLDADPGIGLQVASMTFQTPVNTAFLDGIAAIWSSGAGGKTTGDAAAPHMTVTDRLGTSPVDTYQSGSLIKTTNNGTAYTWQTPTPLGTGWALGPNSGTVLPLQYRLDPLDNLVFAGAVHTTSTTPATTLFTLPSGYRPSVTQRVVCVSNASGTPTVRMVEINSNGGVLIENNLTTASTDVYLNFSIPLGHIA